MGPQQRKKGTTGSLVAAFCERYAAFKHEIFDMMYTVCVLLLLFALLLCGLVLLGLTARIQLRCLFCSSQNCNTDLWRLRSAQLRSPPTCVRQPATASLFIRRTDRLALVLQRTTLCRQIGKQAGQTAAHADECARFLRSCLTYVSVRAAVLHRGSGPHRVGIDHAVWFCLPGGCGTRNCH